MSKNQLIVIAGPTASGKTSLAVDLAKELDTVIISADSRQFYKELSIGTAKPTKEEMQGVEHYFINSHSIHSPLSAGAFEKEALSLLEKLFKKYPKIILVGGSGMFLKALTHGTDQLPSDPEVREKWNKLYEEKGITYLQEHLNKLDPERFINIDHKNPIRLIRNIEIIEVSGKKVSEQLGENISNRSFESHYFILDHPREVLYERINQRVDQMIENGLLDEVKKLQPYKKLQSLNTVGYKELFDYLEGVNDLDTAIFLIKQNTRRYAKRQLTWFRKIEDATWISKPFCINKIKRVCEL